MSIKLQISSDGSHTVYSDTFNETYHSINGAITESIHVFIEAGLKQIKKSQISILEIGFGTGLNAFLSLLEADNRGIEITYGALELYPVGEEVYAGLNYPETLGSNRREAFKQLHTCDWGARLAITEHFSLQKHKIDIQSFNYGENNYDVVYFDAFSPVVQPELWGQDVFNAVYRSMCTGGVLTTYCAKGEVRRTLQRAGFTVERLPGPPGKREMLRAIK